MISISSVVVFGVFAGGDGVAVGRSAWYLGYSENLPLTLDSVSVGGCSHSPHAHAGVPGTGALKLHAHFTFSRLDMQDSVLVGTLVIHVT